jgi:RimJ/RimL family protein N-acetyltransferase
VPAHRALTLPYPDPPLADAVVALRPWAAADVPDRLLAFADLEVDRFSWPHREPYTAAHAHAFYAAQEQDRRTGVELSLAIAAPGDPADVLGGISLHIWSRDDGIASVGYWLAAAARGRGVATHAVRLLAPWGFAALGIARLELTTAPDNRASQRVAERCGFTREALLRSHLPFKGGLRDSVLYSLLPGDLG